MAQKLPNQSSDGLQPDLQLGGFFNLDAFVTQIGTYIAIAILVYVWRYRNFLVSLVLRLIAYKPLRVVAVSAAFLSILGYAPSLLYALQSDEKYTPIECYTAELKSKVVGWEFNLTKTSATKTSAPKTSAPKTSAPKLLAPKFEIPQINMISYRESFLRHCQLAPNYIPMPPQILI